MALAASIAARVTRMIIGLCLLLLSLLSTSPSYGTSSSSGVVLSICNIHRWYLTTSTRMEWVSDVLSVHIGINRINGSRYNFCSLSFSWYRPHPHICGVLCSDLRESICSFSMWALCCQRVSYAHVPNYRTMPSSNSSNNINNIEWKVKQKIRKRVTKVNLKT